MNARTNRNIWLAMSVFLLGLSIKTSIADPNLVGWWKLDEGTGTTAFDSSGNGNDGVFVGNPRWVNGKLGGALEFDGDDYINCGNDASLNFYHQITIAFWFKVQAFYNNWEAFITKGDRAYRVSRSARTGNATHMGISGSDWIDGSVFIIDNKWHHWCGTYDGTTAKIYIDGVLDTEQTCGGQIGDSSACNLYIGENSQSRGRYFHGLMDDVRIYTRALTFVEIQSIMSGGGVEEYPYAYAPNPADGSIYSDTWVTFTWRPGDFAAEHDVYFGTNFGAVANAYMADPTYRGRTSDNNFAPEVLLDCSQTYYWRIDEVNEANPESPWKGPVWSFMTPPRTAYNPSPADRVKFVALDAKLSWLSGFNARLHTVYFGGDFDTVNDAVGGRSQDTTTYNPGVLESGKTYYWRVDEFDGTITYKGNVWSFTTLPEIPILEERITERDFPSVFQAWNPADNLPRESTLDTLARHDLVWSVAEFYGLRWDASEYKGIAESFRPGTISNALIFRQNVLSRNPNMVFLMEIRYRDAPSNFLPANSDWWMRDENSNRIPGWAEGNYFILNYPDPDFQAHVAAQCKASIDTGIVDGILLDWWNDDQDRVNLIKTIRETIGYEPVILVNSNDRKIPNTASYVNGLFMEVYDTSTLQNWAKAADTLLWAEENLLPPRLNCLESWYHKSRQDLHLMRATTTLSLTHSNGYCLFSDPNPLPAPDHLHDWYSFWNKEIRPGVPKLGRPIARYVVWPERVVTRQFEYGIAAYNPAGNNEVTLLFTEPVESVATSIVGLEHILDDEDGDIYFRLSPGTSELERVETVTDEGFETGNFNRFDWVSFGDAEWAVSSDECKSGTYSAKAGSVGDNGSTTLQLTLDCIAGQISFYYKISSEQHYDYLRFYIDGTQQDEWSGDEDWTQVSFDIRAGRRRFEWEYTKDESSSSGSDTAWIDDIVFPAN